MTFHRPIPDSKTASKLSGGMSTLVEAEKLIQIAIMLPSAVFIGWLGGAWLDGHFHQQWIAVAGILFGGVAGLVHVIRTALIAGKKCDEQSAVADSQTKSKESSNDHHE